MTKKPELFHINKHVGQANKTVTLNGREVERAEFLFVKLGEQITFVKAVYDPDHFLYQNHMPITDDDVRMKYLGRIPKEMQGPNVVCTCGAEGVVMLEGPYANMAMCRSLAQFGKHQTSFLVKDNQLVLDKKTADEKLMGDSDLAKTMKSQEQAQDEANDAKKRGE